ncbi:MAG: GTPase HflX [Desulfobacterales bacterium]|nr:GTPase HflX [Desulfobacterales bacterium]
MKRLYGNAAGLKASQLHRLENLYRRRTPRENVASFELTKALTDISMEIRRQVGILIDRQGRIVIVIVGDPQKIVIPDLSEYRLAPGRLRGLRCVHTHLDREALTRDDFTDLALLRLDLMAAITLTDAGTPHQVHVAHILPSGPAEAPYRIMAPLAPEQLDIGCLDLILALEDELANLRSTRHGAADKERALLISVTTAPPRAALASLAELRELARSSSIVVIDTILQQRKTIDTRFLMGRGKLQELTLMAMQKAVSLIVFDQELNASQIRSITDQTDIKVIDRTQLILDIFAQRAQTREGKLQVELAQLRYLMPRLVTKNTAMSRLTGGIGGRGPGETKLEINRRRIRDRIHRLERSLTKVKGQRRQQKSKRNKKGLPVISIIGYTNAGKSTLLNTLTQSRVRAENRLFATLDPASRRLRFPQDMEVIITDTVGFIKDLPKELMVAFRATLEELEGADLLLHVIDVSNPRFAEQIRSVEAILEDLDLNRIPTLRVLNKMDCMDDDALAVQVERLDAVAISALDRQSLAPLVDRMARIVALVRRCEPLSEIASESGFMPE